METVSRTFEHKFESGELSRAVAHFIDYELSEQNGAPKPEFLLSAQVLIESAAARCGFTLQPTQSEVEIVEYYVELILKDKRIRKFVGVPKGIDCKQYVTARFGGSESFLDCLVHGIVSSDEEKQLIRSSWDSARSPELTEDELWLREEDPRIRASCCI